MPAYFYHVAFECFPEEDDEVNNTRSSQNTAISPLADTDIFTDSLHALPFVTPSSRNEPNFTTSTNPRKKLPELPDQAAHIHRHQLGTADRAHSVSAILQDSFASAAVSRRPRTRDWRFDRISIDSIDMTPNPLSSLVSGRVKSPANGNRMEAGRDTSAAKAKFVPLDSKNTELGWGIVHLYRDAEETPGLSYDDGGGGGGGGSRRTKTSSRKRGAKSLGLHGGQALDELDCTTLCVLAVPSYLTPSDFLGFVGEKTTNEVSHFRMVRTERVNRYMVLMKFRESRSARAWQREWNGKAFNSMEPEYCHVVFIKSIRFHTSIDNGDSSTFPNLKNDPLTPQPSQAMSDASSATGGAVTSSKLTPSSLSTKPVAPPTPSLVELPTCPVCLERMDDTTGLLTILCQHVFHCECLQKWRGSGCPVCRYTQGHGLGTTYPGHGAADDDSEPSMCSACGSETNLWICLICGNIGCGRYDDAHAFSHYQETLHCYAMDIDTQRVWDYAGDGYVHRLIQSKPDGKLVELPSALAHLNLTGEVDDESGGADYVPREKLDNIGMEYTYLLTSQLESQRLYFEEKITQAADKASQASRTAEESAAGAQRAVEALSRLEAAHELVLTDTLPALEREKARLERKNERMAEMARRMEKEWKEEKAMNESLLEKVAYLSAEMERLQQANRDLEEQNRDLTFFISGQAKLGDLGDDVREGTLTVGDAPTEKGKDRKGKGKGRR